MDDRKASAADTRDVEIQRVMTLNDFVQAMAEGFMIGTRYRSPITIIRFGRRPGNGIIILQQSRTPNASIRKTPQDAALCGI